MTETDTTQRREALAQLDATLAAMHRLRETATLLAHGLEQSQQALAHNGESLWSSAPEATAALTWQIAQMNAQRALLVAAELDPAAEGKAMPVNEAQAEGEA
jgi:hypothetical protein